MVMATTHSDGPAMRRMPHGTREAKEYTEMTEKSSRRLRR
jgi:hypothetical protein